MKWGSSELRDAPKSINGYIPYMKFSYGGSQQVTMIRTIYVEQCYWCESLLQLPCAGLARISMLRMMLGEYPSCDSGHIWLNIFSSWAMMHLWLKMSFIHWWAAFKRAELQSLVMLQLWTGSVISPELCIVASRYNKRLRLWLVTIGTESDDQIEMWWGQPAICTRSILFHQRSG